MPGPYYVGIGGNNANDGLSWANRKLTLNGAEDIPVAPGDTVYVGAGTYREMLTVDVSGTAGNVITYIGDYDGSHTDGVGGVVRITGSDDDITATRAYCITLTSKNYRTFRGFAMDLTTSNVIYLVSPTYIIVDRCYVAINKNSAYNINVTGASQSHVTVSNCMIWLFYGNTGIGFQHSGVLSDTAHDVNNCLIIGVHDCTGVRVTRVGGITVRNSTIVGFGDGARVDTALTVGQTLTVNNCLIIGGYNGLKATVAAEFVEDYNTILGTAFPRVNVNVGAHSITYPPLFDTRWWFELLGGGNMLSPYDLASYSKLVELNSGTGAPASDARGTAVQGVFREWGPLEYDSSLLIEEGAGGGGGSVSIQAVRDEVHL